MLPVALTIPADKRLPPMALPITLRLFRLPTDTNVEFNTLALSVAPVSALALTLDAITLVSWLPLPIK